jgi:predicted CoA-binding protein
MRDIDVVNVFINLSGMKSWEQDEIKALAQSIWEHQGYPEGRAEEHWREAEEMVRAKWLAGDQGIEHQVRDLRIRH